MLFYEDLSEVVLVGHSYGGMVITGVTAKESQRLAHLVYLDAYLPLEGENEIALWPSVQKERYFTDIASGIKFRSPLGLSMLGITDPKISQWVQERLTSHPYSTYEDPPPSGTLQSASILEPTFTVRRGRFHPGWNHLLQGPVSLDGECIAWL